MELNLLKLLSTKDILIFKDPGVIVTPSTLSFRKFDIHQVFHQHSLSAWSKNQVLIIPNKISK